MCNIEIFGQRTCKICLMIFMCFKNFICFCEIMGIVFIMFAELYVPFWENIAKLLGGRFNIYKMDVQLEIKV